MNAKDARASHRCPDCENFGADTASKLWHKIKIKNPQDPDKLEMDHSGNVGRLYDLWFASEFGKPTAEDGERKERDMSDLLRADAFNRMEASTHAQLCSGRGLGNTNFPCCIHPPKERDGEPLKDDHVDSDFCAVYLSERREFHQKEIWISIAGAVSFARSLGRLVSGNHFMPDVYGICRVYLYYHEIFHFNVERALRRLGGNAGADRLWWNAYVASWGTYDCIEEGMAEAFALQRMKRLPAPYHAYIEPLKTLILKSTPGYSSGVAIAERYAEFKRFFFRKVAGVTGMDDIHEAAFLEMLEDETPRECNVFYVMPVNEVQKREITDCGRLWVLRDIAKEIAEQTGVPDISYLF